MTARGRIPTATYRLQLHSGFTLRHAADVVDYLAALGISHVYASPVLRARHGSTHGYDVTEPRAINPELGGEEALGTLVRRARQRQMGLVLDIVPNHVATSTENRAWDDVLRRGVRSPYARWFDVAWHEAGHGRPPRVVLPALGRGLADVVAAGELTLVRERRGELRVRYGPGTFPLDPATVPPGLVRADRGTRAAFTRGAQGRRRLAALLARQHYRLASWRAPGVPSYRRFFDINELIALRQEDRVVFDDTHAKVLDLVGRGWIDGLRVDHIDGLRDPEGYLAWLRDAVARRAPGREVPGVWVEKIVAPGESLRAEWPVLGTTGYDFLNAVDAVFVAPAGFATLERWYRRRVARRRATFEDEVAAGKRLALRTGLRADLDRLVRDAEGAAPRTTRGALRTAWIEVTTALPVSRTYVGRTHRRGRATDRRLIDGALALARRRGIADPGALARVRNVLVPPASRRSVRGIGCLACVERWQQLSGPAAAKGVEDTALYRYVPLASLNEVGGEASRPLGRACAAFHAENGTRAVRWPDAMLAATTHDTKRSADVRARLHALSEIADEWTAAVERWETWAHGAGARVVDGPTAYLLYQTLVGVWPLPPGRGSRNTVPSEAARRGLHARVSAYMMKAAREAKRQTTWTDPAPGVERALQRLIDRLLLGGDARATRFRRELTALVDRIARPGLWTALARTLLQMTAPGFPDVYQGDELWTFTLVDPDNRRPVDFARRRRLLRTLGGRPTRRLVARLLASAEDGRIKMHVVRAALQARRRDPALFGRGRYRALRAAGPAGRHVVAFLRTRGRRAALVLVPRLIRSLTGGDRPPLGSGVWSETTIMLPSGTPRRYRSVLTGGSVVVEPGRRLSVARLLEHAPVALLVAR